MQREADVRGHPPPKFFGFDSCAMKFRNFVLRGESRGRTFRLGSASITPRYAQIPVMRRWIWEGAQGSS